MDELNIKATERVMENLRDPRFIHITKKEKILSKFNLTHGKGKRKKK